MKELKVDLQERSYKIVVAKSFEYLKPVENGQTSKCVIIADETVQKLYLSDLEQTLKNSYIEVLCFTVKPGEESKSMQTMIEVFKFLLEKRICRDDVIVGLGGGVIGDLAGFVAATYLRGVKLIHVPTSLLAQVDSSIGGKTAVNFKKAKNQIGAFYQPSLVYSNYSVLKSLPVEEIRNGLVEILVHAMIQEEKLFVFIEKNLEQILKLDFAILEELISWNCSIKKSIVERDERENGERAILNFGHTIGHAIESAYDYAYKHGECVALGILGACYIAEQWKLISTDITERITNILNRLKVLHSIKDCDKEKVYYFIMRDKKFDDGKVFFILPKKIGQVQKYEIKDFYIVEQAVEWLMEQEWL